MGAILVVGFNEIASSARRDVKHEQQPDGQELVATTVLEAAGMLRLA